jgi:hypothetical protein
MILGRRGWLEMPHQVLERPPGIRVLHQLLLKLLDPRHQLPRLGLLGHLEQDRLGGCGDHHLCLLTQHLDPLASQARPRMVAMTELAPERVQLAMQRREVDRISHRHKISPRLEAP